ncbi:hypothetical protein [Sphingomonas cynarae]|uniref:hypothetical protein n=1 Tax=Sphingomonas cynarae TaxID=930197 RepID=UPI0031DE63FF
MRTIDAVIVSTGGSSCRRANRAMAVRHSSTSLGSRGWNIAQSSKTLVMVGVGTFDDVSGGCTVVAACGEPGVPSNRIGDGRMRVRAGSIFSAQAAHSRSRMA